MGPLEVALGLSSSGLVSVSRLVANCRNQEKVKEAVGFPLNRLCHADLQGNDGPPSANPNQWVCIAGENVIGMVQRCPDLQAWASKAEIQTFSFFITPFTNISSYELKYYLLSLVFRKKLCSAVLDVVHPFQCEIHTVHFGTQAMSGSGDTCYLKAVSELLKNVLVHNVVS